MDSEIRAARDKALLPGSVVVHTRRLGFTSLADFTASFRSYASWPLAVTHFLMVM